MPQLKHSIFDAKKYLVENTRYNWKNMIFVSF